MLQKLHEPTGAAESPLWSFSSLFLTPGYSDLIVRRDGALNLFFLLNIILHLTVWQPGLEPLLILITYPPPLVLNRRNIELDPVSVSWNWPSACGCRGLGLLNPTAHSCLPALKLLTAGPRRFRENTYLLLPAVPHLFLTTVQGKLSIEGPWVLVHFLQWVCEFSRHAEACG